MIVWYPIMKDTALERLTVSKKIIKAQEILPKAKHKDIHGLHLVLVPCHLIEHCMKKEFYPYESSPHVTSRIRDSRRP